MSEERKLVRVAECAVVGTGEVLFALGLGSCVAILLHDGEARLAGMAHVLLPAPHVVAASDAKPAKFATTAVPHLVEEMRRAGARPDRLVARLVGGASMFRALVSEGRLQTGERNIAASREALAAAGIPIVGEEVGKEHGRSVHFYPADGRAVVSSLRHGKVEL